jgi:camphor 5-monooxygenase
MIEDIKVEGEHLAERPDHVPPDAVVDFDIYSPPGVREGFHKAWAALQKPGMPNLVWTPHNGGHWIATRGRLVSAMLADYQRFSSRLIIVPKAEAAFINTIPTTLDPPAHRPVRNLLNPAFSPKAVGRSEAGIRELAISLIEGFRDRGYCNFTEEYAEKFPIQVFLKMVDLPLEDGPKLKFLADQIMHAAGQMTPGEAMQAFYEYLSGPLDDRIGGDREDMLSRIVNSKIDDRQLTRAEALNLSVAALIGGLDTVVNLLGFIMYHLGENPIERKKLVAEPELIPLAVEEYFRRFPVATVVRVVAADMEYEGALLKDGDMVAMPTMLHGLDEEENIRPMEVEFARDTVNHSTFGAGVHKCVGISLARSEVRITLEEWLARIPDFELAKDTTPISGGGIVGYIQPVAFTWK